MGDDGQPKRILDLADARVERVVAPTRRPLPAHPKLLNPIEDFAHLPPLAPWWRVDGVVSLPRSHAFAEAGGLLVTARP